MRSIKVNSFIATIQKEFGRLNQPAAKFSESSDMLKKAEEQMASERLDDILKQLKNSNDIANEKSLKKLIVFLKERDQAVGIDYRYDTSSLLNAKCRLITEKLCSDVFEGKKIWDFLMPGMPKDENNSHLPKYHHRFVGNVFVKNLLVKMEDTYNFDRLHESLKKKDELLALMSRNFSSDDWILLMWHFSLKKLTGLILNVEGKALDELMLKKNYSTLMSKLEVEMRNKANYKSGDVVYNRAYQFCIMEVYERHRKQQPDYLSTFGYYWGSPDKAQKIELAQDYKKVIASKSDYSSILETINEIAINPTKVAAAKDGFMLAFKNELIANANPSSAKPAATN
jgi:hypothetical protein